MSASKKALIIDDEDGLVSVLTMFLEDLEIEVSSFESVDQYLSSNQTSDLCNFAYMVIDQNLPGTKGLDFLFSLKQEELPEKVIVSSGETIDDERLKSMSNVMVLNKPFDFNSLEGVFS
jgi:DNA-binding NtrC family response regulator